MWQAAEARNGTAEGLQGEPVYQPTLTLLHASNLRSMMYPVTVKYSLTHAEPGISH